MSSNIAVKIVADVVDLQAKFAIAKAESGALSSELNKLAKEAAAAGGQMSSAMRASLNQAAEASVKAKSEMKNLQDQLKRTHEEGSSFAGAMDMMKEGLGALGIAFSVEKVIEFGRAVEENAAHLEHEARVLQLSVTGYQAFRQAAIDSGVGTDDADQAIKRFSKSLAEAAAGSGPAAKALLEMGISTNQSKEAILQQVSAYLLHASATDRDRYATEIFSKSGAEMIPLFGEWAKGVDQLTQHYEKLGRMLSPELTDRAEKSDVALSGAFEHLQVKATPAVTNLTYMLAGFLDQAQGSEAAADKWAKAGATISAAFNAMRLAAFGGKFLPAPKEFKPYPVGSEAEAVSKPYIVGSERQSEKDEVAALSALDGKLRERADLEKSIALATKVRKDAETAGDAAGVARANTVISDLKKQLDSLNKTSFGGGFKDAGAKAISDARVQLSGISGDPTKSAQERRAEQDAIYDVLLKDSRLNAAQINQVTEEKNRADIASDREAANQKRQIDESNSQTGVRLAQIDLQQRRSILEEQVAAGLITKQQELASIIELTQEEGRLQEEAVTKAEQGYARDSAFFQQKENEKKVIAAQTEAEIAAIRRQIQQQTNKEELQGQMSVLRELSSASNTFWGQILSGRVGVLGAMQAAGLNFLQKELEQDTQYVLARMLLSKAALASDQAVAQAGVLLHVLTEGEKTSATVAGTATRAGVQATAAAAENASFLVRAARWIASELGMTAATETAEATKVATKTAALAAAKVEEATMNVASAESYAGVAAAAAASAVAGIPIAGPALAIAAAGETFASLQPYVALAALATGAYDIPNDGPAYLHQGEMVVPKTFATSLRENIRGGDTSSIANSTSVGGDHYEINLHGVDHSNARQTGRDLIDAINYERRTRRSKFKK